MTMTLARENLPAGTTDEDLTWRPLMLDPSDPGDAHELNVLRLSDRVWRTTDTLAQQVRDLAETRLRKEPMAPEAIAAVEEEITGGRSLDRFGRWVYYPWSGRLVHLLPPVEFRELRLDRNRHKVTLRGAGDARPVDGRHRRVVGRQCRSRTRWRWRGRAVTCGWPTSITCRSRT